MRNATRENVDFLRFIRFGGFAFRPPRNLVFLMLFDDFGGRFRFLAPKVSKFNRFYKGSLHAKRDARNR